VVHVNVGNIDMTQLRGVSDKGVGFVKELIGTVIGNQSLQREGEAQQDRASEELKALRKQAEAQAKEAVGDVTDNPDLKREGDAQEAKGEAEREATQARAEAKAHEVKAKEKELEQEAAEEAK